jgi:hypothetical protein
VIAADSGEDTQLLDHALRDRHSLMFPAGLSEVLAKNRKTWRGDAPIAQSCIASLPKRPVRT